MEKNSFLKGLLDVLACPMCKSDLVLSADEKSLKCTRCGNIYPIKDGIPILIPED